MYDQREKAQRDYQWLMKEAVKEAREQGLEQGSIVGGIRILQQLLGEEESSLADLRDLPIQELSIRLAELQQRLRSRGN